MTRDVLPARARVSDDVELSDRLRHLWDLGVAESVAAAGRYRELDSWYVADAADGSPGEDAGIVELQVACALRCTRSVAASLLSDAHVAVRWLPACFGLLESGTMPSAWFRRLLRHANVLEEATCRLLDSIVATWDMGIADERFRRELALLGAWMRDQSMPVASDLESQRAVRTFAHDDGTATLAVTGPIHEVYSLVKRLDACAREVQKAQRRAIENGTEAPFDDGTIAASGRPMTLAAIRYALQTRTDLTAGAFEVPVERFRLCVTVPMMTLLGESDAPGVIEGIAPVPAALARCLAGDCEGWYRVLTDPTTGAFLPLPAARYRPSASMLEHLRLRGRTCSVPGCSRTVAWAAEADHIAEYDHERPERGGRTEIENLHLLCWYHHDQKTRGEIDPIRVPPVTEVEGGAGSEPIPRAGPQVNQPSPSALAASEQVNQPPPPVIAAAPPVEQPAPHTVHRPGSTIWELEFEARARTRDDVDLMTPLTIREYFRRATAHARLRRERASGRTGAGDGKSGAGDAKSGGGDGVSGEAGSPPIRCTDPPPSPYADPPPY